MPTTIKRVTGTTNKLVVAFDASPTVKEVLDALKNIAVEDRTAKMRMVRSDTGQVDNPRRFVFQLESETEVDVPVV